LPPVEARRPRARRSAAAGAGGAPLEPVVMREGDSELFEALRAHRMQVARDEGVPPYVVASDRTLRDLCLQRPRTREQLLSVYGIGPAKVERYGDGLLRVLAGASGG
jgi:ATP-dependent DNA helicase RecQ